jgi:hypothetical protein
MLSTHSFNTDQSFQIVSRNVGKDHPRSTLIKYLLNKYNNYKKLLLNKILTLILLFIDKELKTTASQGG